MKDSAINISLSNDSWTEVTLPIGCTGYAIQALVPGKSFQMKKESTDTGKWTVFPKIHEKTGKELRASISMASNSGYTGSVYVRSRSFPLDLEVIFY